MRRRHLVELHELPGCPAAWRDGLTDVLEIGMRATGMFAALTPRLADALARSGEHTVVDLCSGGGGAWMRLLAPLRERAGALELVLTDIRPSAPGRRRVRDVPGVTYVETPIDARDVPATLDGFRTMFNAFHHFRPDDARRVLADAVADRRGIAIFETTERSLLGLFLAVSLPGVVWLFTPFVRPFSWSRLFWTYAIPVLPFLIAHDAVVSCLRTYDLDELDALVADLPAGGFRWERGRTWVRGFPNRVTWLVGVPDA